MSAGIEADRAAAAGNLPRAIQLLEEAVAADPDNPQLWMKLAALQRGTGQPARALAAVNRVLSLAELDFMALTFRASLVEQLAPQQAGEAWARALAQRPDTPLPPHLEKALEQGREVRDEWMGKRLQRLEDVTGDAIRDASDEEAARITRFRTNAVRQTRVYYSEPTHFFFPGLPTREFQPRSEHPWLADLEAATDDIANELRR